MDGPPTFSVQSKSGPVDAFDVTTAWYYTIHVMLIIYGLGYMASLVLIQNATIENTYFKANNNGVLYSDRFNSLYWIALLFACIRLFIFVSVCSLILYRNSTCCGAKPGGCSIFWLIILVVLLLADLLGFAILSSFYTRCNQIGQVGNPCNDLKWCCVPTIFSDASSLCSITAPCASAVTFSDLQSNMDFTWLYAASTAFVAFDLFFLLLPVGVWVASYATPTSVVAGGVDSGDCEDDLLRCDPEPSFIPVFSKIKRPFTVVAGRNTPQMLAASANKMTKQP